MWGGMIGGGSAAPLHSSQTWNLVEDEGGGEGKGDECIIQRCACSGRVGRRTCGVLACFTDEGPLHGRWGRGRYCRLSSWRCW